MMLRWMLAGALVLAVSAVSAAETKKTRKPAPKSAASGQVVCTAQGCRPVQPGCRVEQAVYLGMSSTFNTEVCN
jgi:hypothetical protein